MKNMYEILNTMTLLEGKGSKPDFLDLDKDGNKTEPMSQAAKQAKKIKEEMDEGSTGDYSAKKARAGKDIGKPGKAFAKIAKSAGERYGSKERGEKVAGAVLAKLRAKEDVETEGNAFTDKLKATPKGGTFKMNGKTYRDTSNVDESQLDELDINLLKAAQKHAKQHPSQKDPESERNIHKKYGYRSDRDETGDEDDYDEWGNYKPKKKAGKKDKSDGPKKRGRPAGTGRKLGAKGPTGKSKLMKKESMDESYSPTQAQQIYDELADLRAVAKQAQGGGQLPQGFASRLENSLWAAMTLIKNQQPNNAQVREEELDEKAVSKAQQRFMGMAHAMQKGEKIPGASKELKKVARTMKPKDVEDFAKTKHKGLPKKVKQDEEVEETTVAGSVATAPAGGKGKKGMIFGKGVYEGKLEEGYATKLTQVLNEGMSINASVGENGEKSLSVNATDEDADQLAQILKMAGIGSTGGSYEHACPACGQTECGCEQMDEATNDLANSPEEETETTDYMTNTIASGLNKKKIDIAGNGQTTIPNTAVRVQEDAEIERNLFNLYQQFKA